MWYIFVLEAFTNLQGKPTIIQSKYGNISSHANNIKSDDDLDHPQDMILDDGTPYVIYRFIVFAD